MASAARGYGTLTSSPAWQQQHQRQREEVRQQPWSRVSLPAAPLAPLPLSSSQSRAPSVLLPPEAAKIAAIHKIHILGDDERSRFIAHALSGVYDSVERLGWRKTVSPRYRNLERVRPSNDRGYPKVEPLAVMPRVLSRGDGSDGDSRINHLIVTGHGHEAAEALRSVKHRVDENTTICLMNDGLGVLEDVRQRVFAGTDPEPAFLLGHMSHKLAFNRTHESVKALRNGVTKFTTMNVAGVRRDEQRQAGINFVKTMQEVQDLRPSLTPFDRWLRFKLPSVIFDSVVEPVCVLLEMQYQGILQNPAARRMLNTLLDEVVMVVDNMPEVEGSSAIRDYMRGSRLRRSIVNRILAKRGHPSELSRRIENGLPTDVEYLNGFFLRQGRQLGLSLPANKMMRDVIKAKHSIAIERLNSHIPIEETSIPSESSFRYRTLPR